jgi:hypothetical protein
MTGTQVKPATTTDRPMLVAHTTDPR